jgi:hypothetical protein
MRTCRLRNMTAVLAWSYWHDAPRTESHSSGRRLQSVSKTQTISKAKQGFRQLPMIKTGEWKNPELKHTTSLLLSVA